MNFVSNRLELLTSTQDAWDMKLYLRKYGDDKYEEVCEEHQWLEMSQW